MGQQDVLDVLENSKSPLTAKEIAKELEDDICQIIKILARLLNERNAEVKIIELNKQLAMKFYGCKHKMRLFYV